MLMRAGHSVVQAESLEEGSEALLIQRFDAVLLGPGLPADAVAAFTARVKELDETSGAGTHTSILSLSTEPAVSGIDGVVPEDTDADALTEAIANLARAIAPQPATAAASSAADLPVLDVEELKAQVAYDDELLVELIDLYLAERVRQSADMKHALEGGELERLSNIAHTLKGSLASLHAGAARANTEALEFAAKGREDAKCRRLLPVLERDLDVLDEHLTALRRSISSS